MHLPTFTISRARAVATATFIAAAAVFATPARANAEPLVIQDADGRALLSFSQSESGVEVAVDGRGDTIELRGTGTADNRIWQASNGFQARAKTSDAGFKIEAQDGRLLRKVKMKEEKIKVSDNNENTNPFELKRKNDKYTVTGENMDLGKVKTYEDGRVKGKNAAEATVFTAKYPTLSSAFASLLIPALPPEERGILFAELLLRGL